MGKVKTKATRSKKAPPPSELVLDLFAPGMTPLHRAGLGGLAATLLAMERRRRRGLIAEVALPGDWSDDEPPWDVDPDRITLRFGEPDRAGEYLRRLFAFAFGIKDKLIDLPGTYRDEQNRAVRAELQRGLETTFLTHTPTAGSSAGIVEFEFEVDDAPLRLIHRVFTSYRHQGWYWLTKKGQRKHSTLEFVNESGAVDFGSYSIDKKMMPGAVVRHSRFGDATAVMQSTTDLLCLYFAIVGTLSLAGPDILVRDKRTGRDKRRPTGVLVVPEVADLRDFAKARPRMSPTTVRQCRVSTPVDAALQAAVRLRLQYMIRQHGISGVSALELSHTSWAPQQLSRVNAIPVAIDLELLRAFEVAMRTLPPRLVVYDRPGERGTAGEWIDSVLRPLVATNIAEGRRWYSGFHRLMIARDRVSKKPVRDQLAYERRGMQDMTKEMPWVDRGEQAIVEVVQQALRRRYGRISGENKGGDAKAAREKRWKNEYERWRIAFTSARTCERFRHSLCKFISLAPGESAIRDEWKSLLPWLTEARWLMTRDLALLGLASYSGGAGKRPQHDDEQEGQE